LTHSWDSEEGKLKPRKRDSRRWGSGEVQIVGVRLLDGDGREKQQFHVGESLTVEMRYRAEKRVDRPVFGLAVHKSDGTHITGPNTQFAGCEIPWLEGEGVVTYRVESLPLLEGLYQLSLAARDWNDTRMYDYHDRLYPFRVAASGEQYGIVTLNGLWKCQL